MDRFSKGYNNDLRGSSGDVKSPRFPALSIRKSVYGYRITVAVGSVVAISLHDAYFYESSKICNDQLTVSMSWYQVPPLSLPIIPSITPTFSDLRRFRRNRSDSEEPVLFWREFQPRILHVSSECRVRRVQGDHQSGKIRPFLEANPEVENTRIFRAQSKWAIKNAHQANQEAIQAVASNIY